ncbi:DNA ligase, ATP-dependent [Aromatoleum aromaticum EbN1]|uniref:DNA ligase, ATP-dependent n=1 Tax=Aromatoleum aromaticum (strain DSM 19018 / LMG 30748 / EbN1) TaxID=76114 RepID=Q5NXR5_AROAE|nr:DNA ligase [Aromatoleum aromaticum]CAI10149.1 DNA ligase, ATP-dependent [Aromatoleum aromaticum EbN1]
MNPFSLSLSRFRRIGRVNRENSFRSQVLATLLSVLLLASPLPAPAETASGPAATLAMVYRADVDPAAYWVSEKLDGVRALWDGRVLRFRSGQPIAAPQWFVDGLPRQALDGELWIGRRSFEQLSGVVRKQQPVDDEWRQVRYMVFEMPQAPGSFTERIARIRAVTAGRPSWLNAVEQFRVADAAALQRRFERVVAAGGEGLMLHRADATWVAGRSAVLLKLTPWLDAEARVVAHRPGKGRLQGMLGALEVETPDGRRFRIGTGFSDAQRRAPPAIGATVTYRYRELTAKGLPRFPRYLRVRELP